MSRTKRYVPHYIIRDALHPYIDPTTGKEYVWGSPERQQYYKQREASNLRGQDGRHRHSEHWAYHWSNPMNAVRTKYRHLISEGIEDHFDALEDHGKIFDWRGYSDDSAELWYEQIEAEHAAFYDELYQQELENDALEAEYERREQELDDLYYREIDAHYDDYWYIDDRL